MEVFCYEKDCHWHKHRGKDACRRDTVLIRDQKCQCYISKEDYTKALTAAAKTIVRGGG